MPPPFLLQLLGQLRRVADDLAMLAEASAVWNIVRTAEHHVQVEDWRFAYRVPRRGVLEVVDAHPIPRDGTIRPA